MSVRPGIAVTGVIALAVAAAAWYAFRPAAVTVETATVARGALRVTVDDQGETRAHDRFVVAAPVAGRIARIELHEGDAVRAGEAVAWLHPAPLGAAEREALEARIVAGQALLREAGEQAQRARAALAQARADHARSERLVREGFVSGQAEERARNAEVVAQADADAAVARIEAAKGRLDADRAVLRADTRAGAPPVALPAPASGRVLRVMERSERVVAAGTPLVVIGDTATIEVVVDVLSTEATRIAPGMPATIENWGGAPLRAHVRYVEPQAFTKVSALGVEEQRVNVVLDFDEPASALGDGFRVDARIVLSDASDALKVPATAVFRDAGGLGVFVVEGGRARRVPLHAGARNRDEVEVIDGLAEGAVVVRFPASDLTDGARVQITPR